MDNGSTAASIRDMVLTQAVKEEIMELEPGRKVLLKEPNMILRDGFREHMKDSHARGMMYLVATCAYDRATGERLFKVDQIDELATRSTNSYAFRMADKICDMMKEGVDTALGKSGAATESSSPSSPSATLGESAP